MDARFAQAWVQVVPSLWQEPFGLTAAEAQMRGTAVIASDTGVLGELITHGRTGLLTPPGDVAALAKFLQKILSNREIAQRMGGNARIAALDRFSLTTFTNRFVGAYRSIIKT